MGRVNLTAGRVRDFACPPDKSQAFLWDSDVPGLAVRATPSGTKAFVFQGKLNGKDLRVTIGDVRVWPIDSDDPDHPGARQEARKFQTLIDKKIDPRQDRADRLEAERERKSAEVAARLEAEAAERRNSTTVATAWADYLSDPSHKWGDLHRRDHMAVSSLGGQPISRGRRKGRAAVSEPGPLAALMATRLVDLDAEAVKAWLEHENAIRPTRAALAYRLLRGFIGWCMEHPSYKQLAVADACTQKRVRKSVSKSVPKAADNMQKEQLTAWFAAVRQIQNPVIAAYLQAVLLTGARRDELLSLRWEDVDFKWRSLVLKDKVSDSGERIVPMTRYVESLLRDLHKRNQTPPTPRKLKKEDGNDERPWEPSPWVFSSRTAASGRLQEPRIQHERACAVAGIPRVTIHGLRRTFKNMTEWCEVPAGVTAQLMGHKQSAIAERHYTARPLDMLRGWHQKIEDWTLEQAGIEQPQVDAQSELRVVTAT